jgi:hypothetical protein
MSNSTSNDNTRPTLTNFEAQPVADAAIAAIVSELQQGWNQHDTGISDRHLAADVAWGDGGAASRYEIILAFAVSDDVIVAHVARYALDPEGQPLKPSSETTGAFSEMALYVLVRRDGAWWLAAAQNTPIRPSGAI